MTLLQISKKYANFVRVGSDGNVQAFDTNGLEFLKTIPSEQLLSKNNTLDDGSGNTIISGHIYANRLSGTSNGFGANELLYLGSGNVNTPLFLDFPTSGEGIILGYNSPSPGSILQVYDNNTNRNLIFNLDSRNDSASTYKNTLDDGSGNMLIGGKFTGLNSIVGAMNGMSLLAGSPDLRIGVTAADASPITIFSGTTSGVRYEVKARILATVGTSATYTITWTEGGVAQTVPLTITAVDTEVHDNFVIAPDASTNITAQITALTTSTVNVDAIVSVLG